MTTWEYRVIDGPKGRSWNPPERVQGECNKLGAEGWELVGTSPILVQYDQGGFGEKETGTDWLMIFKRPVR